jgi:hypothetical protein
MWQDYSPDKGYGQCSASQTPQAVICYVWQLHERHPPKK